MSQDETIQDAEIVGETRNTPTVAALANREHTGSLLRPAAELAQIEKAFADYQTLCSRLLEDDDFQQIGRKKFRKKSAWRKLATAMGVTFQIIDRHKDREGRHIVYAEFVTRATAPNGRFVEGWGSADLYERCCPADCKKAGRHEHCPPDCSGLVHWSHPNHDIPATAETRSKNRSASDLFGMGEVSAEEIVGVGENPENASRGSSNNNSPSGLTDHRCPECGGKVYDNRADVAESGSNKPLWKCSNKSCKVGAKGYAWASWDEWPWDEPEAGAPGPEQEEPASQPEGEASKPEPEAQGAAVTTDKERRTQLAIEIGKLTGPDRVFKPNETLKYARLACEEVGLPQDQWPQRYDLVAGQEENVLEALLTKLTEAAKWKTAKAPEPASS